MFSRSSKMREQQVFVNVAFDFEYIAEDGKKVFMKENEILLLINKTNHDWWQVIRRGDRRPFYAPAKYVVELRPEEVDALRRKHNAEISASMGDGLSSIGNVGGEHLQQQQQQGVRLRQPKAGMTTFSAASQAAKLYNSNNKRSSYSPAGQAGGGLAAHPMDHFFGNSRFQERYRSNSLDSILVTDLNNQATRSTALPNRNSAVEIKSSTTSPPPPSNPEVVLHAQQHHFIKKSPPQHQQQQQQRTLEKRPTFDSLDKRKSWSVDIKPAAASHNRLVERGNSSGNLLRNAKGHTLQQVQQQQQLLSSSKGRISAYQNTQALFGVSAVATSSNNANLAAACLTLDGDKRKKPIPLPRSKIPVPKSPPPSTEAKVEGTKSSLHSRFFSKRSKTDLGSDGLAAYKAKKPSATTKYPAPKVPTFNRPVPQKRSENVITDQKISFAKNRVLSIQETASSNSFEQGDQSSGRLKPELKEKPLFSTFKSQLNPSASGGDGSQASVILPDTDDIVLQPRGGEKRLSKAVSESDLMHTLKAEEGALDEASNRVIEHVSSVEPVSITVNSDSSQADPDEDENVYFVQHSQEETLPDGSINKLVIDTSKSFKDQQKQIAAELQKESEEVKTGEMQLPKPSFKSEPLQITTEPLMDERSDHLEEMSEGADKSCSTSFDSMDDSLLAESVDFQAVGGTTNLSSPPTLDSSGENVELRTKSPSMSTISRSPPSPGSNGLSPVRQHVVPDWDEYEDSPSGRKFYYNKITKEKSWKPPRKPRGPNDGNNSAPTSPVPEEDVTKLHRDQTDEKPIDVVDAPVISKEKASHVEIPNGYDLKTDRETGNSYYVNIFTGVRWFSATDGSGKEYYYEENGNESSWCLPNVSQSIQDNESSKVIQSRSTPKKPLTGSTRRIAENYKSMQEADLEGGASLRKNSGGVAAGLTKTEMLERKFTLPVSSPNIQIGNVSIVVIKQGPLNKTKLIENGKRHRKNWSTSHIVLTDTFLLFFKDQKTFASMQSGHGSNKPDHTVDLKGASVDWCTGDKSKRNNVFQVATVLGLTMLLQDESLQTSAEWYQEIRESIEGLNLNMRDSAGARKSVDEGVIAREKKISETSQTSTLNLPVDKRKQSKVSRTKSLKMKILGSNEELLENAASIPSGAMSAPVVAGGSTNSLHHSKGNIREKLRKFFQRRPTMDDLFKKGIIKNEPVFGSTLRELQLSDDCEVPLFVKKCIFEIEKGELLKTDGVYRQSGNLSHIQKIRLQVDQGNLAILETVDDVHVLTGALKLFFRELKEPLIPWECVDRLLCATGLQNRKQKIRQMRDVIANGMPATHRSTLATLLRHLLKVTELKEFNRMQVPNLAIVFGPTLMWPPSHLVSQNLALDMMQQNIIVESLLNNVAHIL